ncbi:hypothetical protein PHYSODRAFT_494856, partial [Phytophthora sojae]
MENAASSTSLDAGKTHRAYARGQLAALEIKLVLSSSWCLTQASHLIHALSQQQLLVVSPLSEHSRPLSERLLRFACDLHGYKVKVVEEQPSSDQAVRDAIRLAIGAAGVRQERVALWVRQREGAAHSACLVDFIQEMCLGKLPSLTLQAGGEELRDELVLSCIQARKQLEVVTEAELMVEFQRRLQQNLRVCILEEGSASQLSTAFISWMKTRPACHWRRLNFTDVELQRLLPEVAKAALSSPDLCGVTWGMQTIAKYVLLYQNVHLLMMRAASTTPSPASQLDYFLSFMANVTVEYGAKCRAHHQKVTRLENAIVTLTFTRDKVVPTLERLKQQFECQSAEIHADLDDILRCQEKEKQQNSAESEDHAEEEKPAVDPEVEEARWVLRSRQEELAMMSCETRLRLEGISRFLAEWHQIADRMSSLYSKWTQELDQEKSRTEHEIMGIAVDVAVRRAYAYTTALSSMKRSSSLGQLAALILESVVDSSSTASDERLKIEDDTEDDRNWLVRLIWTSRFPFLRDADVYRSVRLADALCDHVPVFVDTAGVLQRFLVHIFSGHTLFSALPGCGAAGEVESENPSATKESMVLSCDDPKLECQLQEAQRLAIPVLLVNFHSADKELLDRLQPFLAHARISHGPPRRPMLHELTLKYYEDQRKQKQRRTSIAGSAMAAMSSLAQTAATLGGGAAMMARRAVRAGKHKAITIDPLAVAATVSNTSTTTPVRDTRATSNGSSICTRCFQIYAVTATPVPLQIQHDLAAQFKHFAISLPDTELEDLLKLSRVSKTQPKLLQELRGDQIGVAECWVKVNQSRDQLMQLLETLKPVVEHDDSPFASRRGKTEVTVQLYERYSELALQFSNEYQAELMWSSREKDLQVKNNELAAVAKQFAFTAIELVGVARCMTTISSLKFGVRSSPFYLQNFRYLENIATQQLAAQGDDALSLSAESFNAIVERISSGFISTSHRQLFTLLGVLCQQARGLGSTKADNPEFAVWNEAVVWLVTSSVRRAGLNVSDPLQHLDESEAVEKDMGVEIIPRRRNSLKWPGDSGSSLVERLRRRVKLCA